MFLVDRAKDMIVTGGENVYSTEVEDVLYRHPAVLEAAVFAVPDDRWGEAVHAVVVPRDDAGDVDGDELVRHCRASIAGYKVPKRIDVRHEPLPKSGAGKVLKRRAAGAVLGRPGDDDRRNLTADGSSARARHDRPYSGGVRPCSLPAAGVRPGARRQRAEPEPPVRARLVRRGVDRGVGVHRRRQRRRVPRRGRRRRRSRHIRANGRRGRPAAGRHAAGRSLPTRASAALVVLVAGGRVGGVHADVGARRPEPRALRLRRRRQRGVRRLPPGACRADAVVVPDAARAHERHGGARVDRLRRDAGRTCARRRPARGRRLRR